MRNIETRAAAMDSVYSTQYGQWKNLRWTASGEQRLALSLYQQP